MDNVTQVIERFGGYGKAQVLFGVSRSLLAEWEVKGIPPKRWPQIVELSRQLAGPEITIDTLACVRPSKEPKVAA